MADAVFNEAFDEGQLASVVGDWLLSRYGLRLVEAKFKVTGDGIGLDTASSKAEACSKCEPELYVRIRSNMDSKVAAKDCPACGVPRVHSFFLAAKSDRLDQRR